MEVHILQVTFLTYYQENQPIIVSPAFTDADNAYQFVCLSVSLVVLISVQCLSRVSGTVFMYERFLNWLNTGVRFLA